MRGFRCSPAAKQDIESKRQIDQRDESQPLIDGAVRRDEDDLDVEPGCALEIRGVCEGTQDGVRGMCPDAAVEHLLDERGEPEGGAIVDCYKDVAGSNTGPVTG